MKHDTRLPKTQIMPSNPQAPSLRVSQDCSTDQKHSWPWRFSRHGSSFGRNTSGRPMVFELPKPVNLTHAIDAERNVQQLLAPTGMYPSSPCIFPAYELYHSSYKRVFESFGFLNVRNSGLIGNCIRIPRDISPYAPPL